MNVRWGYFDISDLFTMPFEEHELERYRVRPGDLIVCEGGEPGRCAIWADASQDIFYQKALHRIRPVEALDIEYLRHHIEYDAGTGVLDELFTGTTIKHLTGASLARYEMRLPPLNEQRRIVDKIEALNAKSRRAKQALDAIPPLLDKLRQSILAAAFRGDLTADWRAKNPDVEPASKLLDRIRAERRRRWEEAELEKLRAKGKAPTDDRWKAKYKEPAPVNTEGLPELPEGWVWARWTEVGESQNGRAFPSSEYVKNGVCLLRPGNLHLEGWVTWTEENTKSLPQEWVERYPDYLVEEGEIVMNLTAQSLKDEFLGRVCMTRPGERCLLNQRLARLTPILVVPRYAFLWMKSPAFREFVDSLNTGSLIQHMFTSQVDEHVLPIPPVAEQDAIVKRVDDLIAQRTRARIACDDAMWRYKQLSASILAKAFRGELVPQDPNDEPATVLLERIRAERQALGAAKSQRTRTKRALKQEAAE